MLHAFYIKWVPIGCFILFCFLLVCCFSQTVEVGEEDIEVNSLNNKLTLSFHLNNGIPFYSLKKDNTILINNSRLGLRFNGDNTLDKSFKLLSFQISDSVSTTSSQLLPHNQSKVLKVILHDKARAYKRLTLLFILQDNKLSFRYQVPLQALSKNHDIVLIDELTEFSLTNNYDAQIRTHQKDPKLENSIGSSKVVGLSEPIKMPLIMSYGDSLSVSISEDSQLKYQPIALINNGNNTLKINVVNKEGKAYLKYSNPSQFMTSWRVIEISTKELSL